MQALEMRDVVRDKLQLKNSQMLRLLLSAEFSTLRLPSDGVIVKATGEGNKAFQSLITGKKGHSYGLPDIYACLNILRAVHSAAPPLTQSAINGFIDLHPMQSKQLNRAVKSCRLEKMHDSHYKRLLFGLSPSHEALQFMSGSDLQFAGRSSAMCRHMSTMPKVRTSRG